MIEQLGISAVGQLVGVAPEASEEGASDAVERALASALVEGVFVLVREREDPRRLDAPRSTPLSDLVVPAEPIVPAAQTRSFAVRLVDAYGDPLAGIEVSLDHAEGRETLLTAADGWLRVEDVRWTGVEASLDVGPPLREAVVSAMTRSSGKLPLTREDGVEVVHVRQRKLGPVRISPDEEVTISVQPFVVLGRLVGMHFDTDRDLPLPASLAMLPELGRLYERCRPCDVLVVGHTDTSGTVAHNEALSLRRAAVVRALLVGDVDDWLARFDAPEPWGAAEVGSLIDALPDASARSPEQPRVKWFQTTRGLAVDGDAGPVTREALVRETMDRDGLRFPDAPKVLTHGCGEAFPLDATGLELDKAPVDGASDPLDRRVEVLFFDKALGIEPPPPNPTSAAGSTEYPAWRSSASQTHQWVLGAEALELVLRDAEGQPVPGARYRVTLPAGAVIEGELDGDGFARVDRVPAGECRVEFPDHPQGCDLIGETGL